MSLLTDALLGLYIGVLTGIIPALVAWVLGFVFKYVTGVTLPGFGVVVLGVAIAGVQGGLLGLTDPAIAASPATLVALLVVMMLVLYAHSQGDAMGAAFPRRVTLRGLRDRTLSSDVVERIGGLGQVRVTVEGPVEDIEGYPPLPTELREAIAEERWTFPADLSVGEIERRIAEQLRTAHDLGDVAVSLGSDGAATVAAAPPFAGVSRRLAPDERAVSVDLLVPSGLARGDDVTLDLGPGGDGEGQASSVAGRVVSAMTFRDGEEDGAPSEARGAPTTDGGDGRVTVAVETDAVTRVLGADDASISVAARGERPEFEAIEVLQRGGERIVRLTVGPDSELADATIADLAPRERYGVAVVAVRGGERWHVAPPPSTVLAAGTELYAVGGRDALARFREVAT